MKIILNVFVILIIVFLVGCRTSETTIKNQSEGGESKAIAADSTTDPQARRTNPPTAVMPNASYVTAMVDSIILVDEFRYRLFVTIRTAEPRNNMASLAEPGQSIELRPDYLMSSGGLVDSTDERNAHIILLRRAKAGETFNGIISMSAPGKWVISRVKNIPETD